MKVVIRSRFGFTSEQKDGAKWRVAEGDVGVLEWTAHPRYARFATLQVAWDTDPDRAPGSIVLSAIEIIGIEVDAQRILVFPIT